MGAGPAGLTAGLYASRSGHKVLVIEKAFAGGQMALTSEVENYPGFSEPVSGMLLAQTMEQQATRFGCEMLNAEATGIAVTSGGFEVTTTAGPVAAATVIVCSGVKPKQLGVPGETELAGRGVSYCAICDGPLFRGREVAVLGGGDSALEEAIYLTRFASKVTVVHRRTALRGSKVMQDKAFANPKIQFRWNSVLEDVLDVSRGVVTAAMLILLMVGAGTNFEWLFLQFHLLSFNNNFWYSNGYMTMLFPQGFWYDMAMFTILMTATAAALIGGAGYLLMRFMKKKEEN